jgi:hypothetical protein
MASAERVVLYVGMKMGLHIGEVLYEILKVNKRLSKTTTVLNVIIIIQFNSSLFACQLNSPRTNYKVSTIERKEKNIHKAQKKVK